MVNRVDVEFSMALSVEVKAESNAASIIPSNPVGISWSTILGYTISGFSNPGNKWRAITPGMAMMKRVSIVKKPVKRTPLRPSSIDLELSTRCTSVWLFAQK